MCVRTRGVKQQQTGRAKTYRTVWWVPLVGRDKRRVVRKQVIAKLAELVRKLEITHIHNISRVWLCLCSQVSPPESRSRTDLQWGQVSHWVHKTHMTQNYQSKSSCSKCWQGNPPLWRTVTVAAVPCSSNGEIKTTDTNLQPRCCDTPVCVCNIQCIWIMPLLKSPLTSTDLTVSYLPARSSWWQWVSHSPAVEELQEEEVEAEELRFQRLDLGVEGVEEEEEAGAVEEVVEPQLLEG